MPNKSLKNAPQNLKLNPNPHSRNTSFLTTFSTPKSINFYVIKNSMMFLIKSLTLQ